MKTYIITAIFLLTLPFGYAQFQPTNGNPNQHPECGFNYSCFHEKSEIDQQLEREEQQEEESFEEFEIENKRIEELKKNAEQPGLNQ